MPEWQSLVELAREEPVDVRFIELMPIGHGKDAAPIYHERLYPLICGAYPNIEPDEDSHGPGPAVYYKVPGFRGSVGFISAVHGKFCATCNRVRLTAQGYLKTCLCYEDGVDLRSILRSGYPEHKKWGKLIEAMHSAIEKKPATHCFERPDQVPERKNMSMIGG
jgi:cyclic pyranopterin phosphate synthase